MLIPLLANLISTLTHISSRPVIVLLPSIFQNSVPCNCIPYPLAWSRLTIVASAGLSRPLIAVLISLCSHELLGLLNGHDRLQFEQLNPLKS